MKKVHILMSTYNGEKYISDQIDSLLNQHNVEISLSIRDDCSSDNTIKIIRTYIDRYSSIELFTGENLRPAKSFIWLVEHCVNDSPYFAFCDQDDVWLPDKLYAAVEQLKEFDSKPALYYCSTQNVNEILKPMDRLYTNPKHTTSLADSIATGSLVPGCTIVFNQKLMSLLKKHNPQNITMHDTWVHLVCLTCGGIVIGDATPHILYRQHGTNVIGSGKKSVISRLNKICHSNYQYSKMITELYFAYNEDASDKSNTILKNYVGYQHNIKKQCLITEQTVLSNLCVKDKVFHLIKIWFNKF